MYFPDRLPEPQEMSKIENDIFSSSAKRFYQLWFIPLVDNILEISKLNRGSIVDVGCGPGFLVKELAKRSKSFTITGIDVSKQAIGIAKTNCKGLKNANFKKGNAHSLPFQDKSINLVVCRDSFHHFSEPSQVLKEMYRILKVGGLLYIQDLRRDIPNYLLQHAIGRETVFQKLQYYSVRASYTTNEMKLLLRDCGFKDFYVKIRYVTKKMKDKYSGEKIQINKLRQSFQAHYVAVIRKS